MKQLHKQSGAILIRGIIAVIFGLIAIFAPGIGLQLIVLLFGAFSFVDGLAAFFVGMGSRSFILILEGLIGVLVGLYILFMTAQAILIFLFLIGIWAIATGLLEVIAGIELRKHVANEIWLLFVGIVSILFGILVFVNPLISGIAITFVLGIYAVMFGVMLIALSQAVKNYKPTKSSKR
jgi:uncharacterized membrane protein HdeD (DUF308 family)